MTADKLSRSSWVARIGYLMLPVLPVIILTYELASRRFPGRFIYPEYFGVFKFLHHFQDGLLVGLIVAVIGAVGARVNNRWLRFALYLPISLWLIWLIVWTVIRAAFTIELSPRYVIALATQSDAIRAVGLNEWFFYAVILISLALALAISAAGAYLSRRVSIRFTDRVALLFLALFVVIHMPVRAYVTYHVNRSQFAVLALDDWSPIALRTEYLMPGVRARRAALPNLEDTARTRTYLEWIKQRPAYEIPRKFDIVWIVIEAFRADAITEQATPYLWSHADEFQLKLDRNHWSGGNATQFGLFSMFTGLGGYHLQTFLRAGAHFPLFTLLMQNGYRVRIAEKRYFNYARLHALLPPSVLSARARKKKSDQNDAAMTDALLADMSSRPPGPSLDIVTFDATHWPFSYPPEDALFTPAARAVSHANFTRTAEEAAEAFNRYRNATHFIDRQIGRVVESLRARGALDRTIVIVTGDHGEEFMERGQVFHCGAMNDFQGRTALWIRFPDSAVAPPRGDGFTSHIDLVPTLLDFMGFDHDILRTQGDSMLHPQKSRNSLLVSEQGYHFPFYNALVTKDYISRWRNRPRRFLFSGVERRDGRPVIGDEWLNEAKALYPMAARDYEILPDPAATPSSFPKNSQ